MRKAARNIEGMDGWDRVMAAVVDRRAALGWTQKDLAAKAGVSERTIQNVEAGARPQARNRHKIEVALGWPSGEMRRIEEEPDRGPQRATPEGLLAAIYDELPPERAARVAELVEAELSGRPTGRPAGAR